MPVHACAVQAAASSANAPWKTHSVSVDGGSRQRSSSDPPAVHPPLPPLRVTSTSTFFLFLSHQWALWIWRPGGALCGRVGRAPRSPTPRAPACRALARPAPAAASPAATPCPAPVRGLLTPVARLHTHSSSTSSGHVRSGLPLLWPCGSHMRAQAPGSLATRGCESQDLGAGAGRFPSGVRSGRAFWPARPVPELPSPACSVGRRGSPPPVFSCVP